MYVLDTCSECGNQDLTMFQWGDRPIIACNARGAHHYGIYSGGVWTIDRGAEAPFDGRIGAVDDPRKHISDELIALALDGFVRIELLIHNFLDKRKEEPMERAANSRNCVNGNHSDCRYNCGCSCHKVDPNRDFSGACADGDHGDCRIGPDKGGDCRCKCHNWFYKDEEAGDRFVYPDSGDVPFLSKRAKGGEEIGMLDGKVAIVTVDGVGMAIVNSAGGAELVPFVELIDEEPDLASLDVIVNDPRVLKALGMKASRRRLAVEAHDWCKVHKHWALTWSADNTPLRCGVPGVPGIPSDDRPCDFIKTTWPEIVEMADEAGEYQNHAIFGSASEVMKALRESRRRKASNDPVEDYLVRNRYRTVEEWAEDSDMEPLDDGSGLWVTADGDEVDPYEYLELLIAEGIAG